MIVGTPRPGSPSRCAHAPRYSTSDDALDLLPSLSFRRCSWNPEFFVPSGKNRGSTKHVRPSSVCANVKNTSHIGAEQNHLCPVSEYSPSMPRGTATVVLARTSEPPCFSVIAIPHVAPSLSGRSDPSYDRDTNRGTHSESFSAGTAANVIVIGQQNPASACMPLM